MDYSAFYALAKSGYMIWFLILVVFAVALCWTHYQDAQDDALCAAEPTPPTEPEA